MAWKLYYGDGSEFSDQDGTPEAAPSLNVQAIAQVVEGAFERHTVSAYDYYWFEHGEWFGGDLFGLWDFLQRSGAVKFGRAVSRQQFESCLNKAVTDPMFPDKTTWLPGEKRP